MLTPDYWLIWEEKEPPRKYSQKFKDLLGVNDFMESLRPENIASVEVISGFCLKKQNSK